MGKGTISPLVFIAIFLRTSLDFSLIGSPDRPPSSEENLLFKFGDLSIAFIILFVVGSIQVIIGNFIEPKWMGNSMNISPLVSILSLMFWGLIWGTTGMIVSVPFTVVIIIILSEIEYTRPLAILLSEKGDINERE